MGGWMKLLSLRRFGRIQWLDLVLRFELREEMWTRKTDLTTATMTKRMMVRKTTTTMLVLMLTKKKTMSPGTTRKQTRRWLSSPVPLHADAGSSFVEWPALPEP